MASDFFGPFKGVLRGNAAETASYDVRGLAGAMGPGADRIARLADNMGVLTQQMRDALGAGLPNEKAHLGVAVDTARHPDRMAIRSMPNAYTL